ncbi:MAG: hypothetical protein KKI02_12085 [Planctomycetes bacterium]|nr:hypothetical protein [Planctomycetota bacterium]
MVDDEVQAANAQIVSVRANDVYQIGHVPGAINIPWQTIADEDSLEMLALDKKIVTYCSTGHTGQVAATILGMLGYDVDNMLFGMMGWTDDADVLGGAVFDCHPPQYRTETTGNCLPADQDPPVVNTGETTAEAIVRAQVAAFLSDWVPTISAAEVKAVVDDPAQAVGHVIVSVRSVEDYANGHIPGAINIPWKTLVEEGNLEMLPADKKIIVYCYTGHTSQITATLLKLLGYDAVNMKYGMTGWNDNFLGDIAPFDCLPPSYETIAGPDPL